MAKVWILLKDLLNILQPQYTTTKAFLYKNTYTYALGLNECIQSRLSQGWLVQEMR